MYETVAVLPNDRRFFGGLRLAAPALASQPDANLELPLIVFPYRKNM